MKKTPTERQAKSWGKVSSNFIFMFSVFQSLPTRLSQSLEDVISVGKQQ